MPFDHIQERNGTLVGGQYRLLRMIGEGGMGAVFEADDVSTGERVAVKLIKPQFSQSSEVNARFLQEANTVAAIGHPNIVRVIASGTDAEGPYMVLELLDGETVGDVLERRPLGPREALYIGAEMLDALQAAHDAQVIHRDIKPENIFLLGGADACRGVRLLDFGISKILSADHNGGLTRTGMAVGTPDYMSPEQASGARIDGRSDLWAVGAVLYESIARTPPFEGENYQQLLARILMTPHVPLHERVPAVPQEVSALIDKALAKEASGRFASAGEMRDAVRALRNVLPGDETLGPRDDPTQVVPSEYDPTVVRMAPPPSHFTDSTPVVRANVSSDNTPVVVAADACTPQPGIRQPPSDAFTQIATEIGPSPLPPHGVTAISWTAAQPVTNRRPRPSTPTDAGAAPAAWLSAAVVSGAVVGVLVGVLAIHHRAALVRPPRPLHPPPSVHATVPFPGVDETPSPPPVQTAPAVPPSPPTPPTPAQPMVAPEVTPAPVSQVLASPPRGHPLPRLDHVAAPVAVTGPPMVSSDVMPSLRPLLVQLQNCARGVGGNVTAVLSIDVHGTARVVRLEGPFARTDSASCVSHTLQTARYPEGRPTPSVRIVFGLTP